jgi:hypothetical protein
MRPVKLTVEHKTLAISVMGFARKAMETNFIVDGKVFNMERLGWSLSYNTNKSRLGVCKTRNKQIELSMYFLKANLEACNEMRDTILHEIAHAIDVEIRGYSDHSENWKRIARAVGADDSRTANVDMTGAVSKYTATCPNCKRENPMHRKTRGNSACGKCCKKYNYGRYSTDYIFTIRQNY